MAKKLMKLKINTLGSVDTPANQHGKALLFKRADDVTPVEQQSATILEKLTELLKSFGKPAASTVEDPKPEDVTKVEGLCATCNTQMVDGKCPKCEVAKAATTPEQKDGDEIMKLEDLMKNEKLSPEVKAFLQEQEDAKTNLEKSLKDTQDAVEIEKAARLDREYLSKAQSFTHLAQKPEDFGAVLKGIATKAPDEYAKLEPMLKAWNEAMTQSTLFTEVGKSNPVVAGSAEEEINKRAAELMKADTSLNTATATTKVLEADPSLYKKYNEELDAAE